MKISLRARQITDADISLISLVKRGATRAPFKILKSEQLPNAPANVDVGTMRVLRDGLMIPVNYLFEKLDGRESFIAFVQPQQKVIDGVITTALAAFEFVEGVGESFVGWVDDRGRIVNEKGDTVTKREIRKQEAAAPGTVGEQAADTPAQVAGRARLVSQYQLERKVELLTRRLEDSWEAGNVLREQNLTQQIEDATLALESLRDAGTRVVKTDSGYELVKVTESYSDAFAHRGGQSFQHDDTDDLSDLVGPEGGGLGLRGDSTVNIVKDDDPEEIELPGPFASLESASRAIRKSAQGPRKKRVLTHAEVHRLRQLGHKI